MPRTVRTRTRTDVARGRAFGYLNEDGSGPPATDVLYTDENQCMITDRIGRPVEPSPLASTQVRGHMRLHGLMYGNGRSKRFDGVPFYGNISGIDNLPLPPPNGWYLDTVAGTNPSRPVFTPPTVLQDLITLPRLLRETGDFLRNPRKLYSPRQAANAHLAARFGWGPLLEDLGKLINLQSYILKRTKELKQLYSGRGLRRRLKFGESNQVYKGSHAFPGFYSQVATVQLHHSVVKRSWATIRWYPNSLPPYSPDDESQNRFVKRLIFGITPEGLAKGLWDVIPWTWLLGWFTNIGKFALANSNTVPAGHTKACFMSEVRQTRIPGLTDLSGGAKGILRTTGEVTIVRKTRVVSGALTPGFNMPFMDISRLSVLGSLAIQRLAR